MSNCGAQGEGGAVQGVEWSSPKVDKGAAQVQAATSVIIATGGYASKPDVLLWLQPPPELTVDYAEQGFVTGAASARSAQLRDHQWTMGCWRWHFSR